MTVERILIVCENASAKFGGEAILPLHYFRYLRARGLDVHLVTHARTQAELQQLLPDEQDRIHYTPDTRFRKFLEKIAAPFPSAIKHFTFRLLGRILSGISARKLVRSLVAEHQIQIVHQPTPVSPREFSLIYNVGAPVVIGPMNGNITYPPGFQAFQNPLVRTFIKIGRLPTAILNYLIPGKLRAAALLVANSRTAEALPRGSKNKTQTLVENGVDLKIWTNSQSAIHTPHSAINFVFSGRLVDWKGIQYLLTAFATVTQQIPSAHLDILGSGPMLAPLKKQADELHLADKITFHGWQSQPACARIFHLSHVFVLPSLYECGGAVVLEALAGGLPVIATNWGGPADYVTGEVGILVTPESPQKFPDHLAAAMLQLANHPELRQQLSQAAPRRAAQFDWNQKIEEILKIYTHAAAKPAL